jgi:hypothetical protein
MSPMRSSLIPCLSVCLSLMGNGDDGVVETGVVMADHLVSHYLSLNHSPPRRSDTRRPNPFAVVFVVVYSCVKPRQRVTHSDAPTTLHLFARHPSVSPPEHPSTVPVHHVLNRWPMTADTDPPRTRRGIPRVEGASGRPFVKRTARMDLG